MPLSDREKRLLDEMEAALLTEDPRLVSALSANPKASSRGKLTKGIVCAFFGLLTVMAGAVSKLWPIGILGFVVALLGVNYAISSFSTGGVGAKRLKNRSGSSKLRDRMDKRWDDRKNS